MSARLNTDIQRLEELRTNVRNIIIYIFNLKKLQEQEDEQRKHEQWLEDYLRQQYGLLCDAFEKLNDQSTITEIKQGFARFTNLRDWKLDSTGYNFISPAQNFLSDYIELLSMQVRKEPETHAHAPATPPPATK